MNIHVVQTDEGRIEARLLMGVEQAVISASTNSPVISAVQNQLIMSYMTSMLWDTPDPNGYSAVIEGKSKKFYTSAFVSKAMIMDAIFSCYPEQVAEWFPGFLESAYPYYASSIIRKMVVKKSTGERFPRYSLKDQVDPRLLLSIAFPRDLTIEINSEQHPEFPKVEICKGIILPTSGPITKKIIGNARGSLIHVLWCPPWSPGIVVDFLRKLNRLMIIWSRRVGFSLSIKGCHPPSLGNLVKDREEMFGKCITISKDSLIPDYEKEERINSIIDNFSGIGGRLVKEFISQRSQYAIMANSGAKGSLNNVALMSYGVQQQTIENKRIPLWYEDRALPHLARGDTHPKTRGYVTGSYVSGLSPVEYFFHCAASRTGGIDTATKTGGAGYASKEMNAKTRNYRQHYDGSVRDLQGQIVQYVYGDDTINAKFILHTPKGPFFVNPKVVANSILSEDPKETKRKLYPEEIAAICGNLSFKAMGDASKLKPLVNLITIIQEKLASLLQDVEVYPSGIVKLAHYIAEAFYASRNPEGAAVGQGSSAALSQEQVQLTLNTHQLVGGKAQVTAGLPQLLELLHATEAGKRTCYIYFNDEEVLKCEKSGEDPAKNRKFYQAILERSRWFPLVTLGKLIKTIEVSFIRGDDGSIPNSSPVTFIKPKEFQKSWWNNSIGGNWAVVITFDKSLLYYYRVTLSYLKHLIDDSLYGNDLDVIVSPEAIGQIVISIRNFSSFLLSFNQKEGGAANMNNLEFFVARDAVVSYIKELHISGIPEIVNAAPYYDRTKKKWCVLAAGAHVSKGSCLRRLLAFPGVDPRYTVCSNMHEVCQVFGIHATRRFIFEELVNVLERNGSTMNHRHVELIVDSMVSSGRILKVAEDGIRIDTEGPVAKVLFQKGTSWFVTAAALGLEDDCRSSQARIATGAQCLLGSGSVNVYVKK
jgi:DNA-directed RNA polymerase beta' subunit